MKDFPRAPGFDSTLPFLQDPYRFISRTCNDLRSQFFLSRFLGRQTVFLTGAEAAEMFYNPNYTSRLGAAPEPIRATLFGKGAIQSMDGPEHAVRKKIFMSYMTREKVDALTRIFKQQLDIYSKTWAQKKRISLYDEMQKVLTKTVCLWVGIPLRDDEVEKRSRDLADMFDSAAAWGPSHLRSRWARKRTERWISDMVQSRRDGKSIFPSGSPAETFSLLPDESGVYISKKESANEIINILRPTVAVSVYIVFALHALHFNPQYKEKLNKDTYLRYYFAQEVRRLYPFFPAVTARAKHDFTWKEYHFPKGLRLVLDLYGTNHNAKEWDDPERFYPERFVTKFVTAHNLIPQGGGDPFANHRCPGENPTIILVSTALEHFTKDLAYVIPTQDLELDYSRLPAVPKSRLILAQVEVLIDSSAMKKDPGSSAFI